MKLTDSFKAPVLDMWSAFEALRRLGFSSDDIYFRRCRDAADPLKRFSAAVELQCQGLTFVIMIPSTRDKDGEVVTGYMNKLQDMCSRLDTLPHEELLNHFMGWLASVGGAPALVTGLLNKGFKLPRSNSN